MTSIFDLPTHVLVLHFPVVMIPLVCTAAAALALRPSWRRRYGWVLVGLAFIVLVATLITVSSGEAYAEASKKENQPLVKSHADLAKTLRLFVVGFFVSVAALVGHGWWSDRQRAAERADQPGTTGATRLSTQARGVGAALIAATLAFSVLSTVWVIRTGHQGAKSAYELVDLSG